MKKVSVLVATVTVALGISATSCDSKRSVNLKKDLDSASYALGLVQGDGFRPNIATLPGEPLNVDLFLAGLEAGMKEDTKSYKISVEEAQNYLNTYFQAAQEREMQARKEEGEKFLEENKAKSGVITTESGLQYQVVSEGNGPKPTADNIVKVHYTGTLLDGSVFDSSVEKGEPATFGVTKVIRGWTEALQLMPVGSKYIIWVPADLAYGERGAGQLIKPNSTLKFEVELLEIVE
ncbi:MAG: FKBP-type peptidyl-prolyl cis-trans isomerase [Tannerellaceae bacterium]|nr:FKBP-type peptidyl-prolyl cis-trans isomerase [Tannerellaceae bacterium]